MHVEILVSYVDKDCGLKGVYHITLGAQGLLRVQDAVLLKEVEAKNGALVGLPWDPGSLNFDQVVQLSKVVEVELLAGVDDGVDVEQLLREHGRGVGR